MTRTAALGVLLMCTACSSSSRVGGDWPRGEIVDLTHSFDAETLYWPTADRFSLKVESKGLTEAGYYYEANSFCTAEHGGTHLDAPIHFAQDRWTADQIPLQKLMGAGVLVDVSAAAAANRDYLISVADLKGWEAEHDRLPRDAIVLFRTGYSRHWPDPEQYLGTATRGEAGVAELHFPGLDPEAAAWLVAERQISAIGIDTASIDYGQSKSFRSHQTLFDANIPAFENVAALDRLPATGFSVIALPMKIGGGSGGPLRIVAVLAP